jgi:phosphotransferase system  glucose/maltose/N-acetylglucosamine-specific IIC component
MEEISRRPPAATPGLSFAVRIVLLGIALFLTAIFGIALWLNPYDGNGEARTMETHRQLGLPPCTFYDKTGLPCPSCGMTTSFSLLIRGDVGNSLRANFVGTLLAAICLAYIPWSLLCVVRKRTLFIASMDRALFVCILSFVVLMLLRWGIVLVLAWQKGSF